MTTRFVCMVFFTLLFGSSISIAQTKDEKAVAAAVETLKKAMIDADKTTLETIADNALTYGHSSGKVEDKKAFVENIVNGNSDFVTIELKDQTIQVAEKTAIVRHVLDATTNDKGKAGAVHISVLTVWIKKGSDWKLFARQAVKLQ